MPVQDQALWERIATYEFPDSGPIGALRRSVQFDISMIQRVEMSLMEYRRFIYLVASQDDHLRPSSVIAAIWYGHSKDLRTDYDRFEKEVVGRCLPEPPAGTFDPVSEDYRATKKLYAETFGFPPDVKIWPDKATYMRRRRYRWASLLAFALCLYLTYPGLNMASPEAALFLVAFVSIPILLSIGAYVGPWSIGWPAPDHSAGREDTILNLPEGEDYRNAIG